MADERGYMAEERGSKVEEGCYMAENVVIGGRAHSYNGKARLYGFPEVFAMFKGSN